MKCGVWCGLVTSAIGVFLGLAAHITFTYVYKNEPAGAFAIISAVFAAVCFHIHFLFYQNKLEFYHSFETMDKFHILGFVGFISGLIAMSWCIFSSIYYEHDLMDVATSPVITAVWAFMTAKWSMVLMLISARYTKILRESHALLQRL